MAKSNLIKLLKPYITNKNIEIGDFTYYYTFDGEQGLIEFQNKNVLYHFPQFNDTKLVIGNYCAIADQVKFIMSGANHRINTISTYPFEMFKEFNDDQNLIKNTPEIKGETVVGHDVWIGYGATIMPGVKIGNGSIIGAMSVVTKNVEPYTIVAGNPAKIIRKRFSDKSIEKIEKLRWWDKSPEEVKKLLPLLTSTKIEEDE
ncbi:virginiamycin A acetyltransferase [Spiroplasma helicoides]|uniref:Virginiamycin A acetyltransferase n=1 Tax=Spiroplasma helicoides TaxID=216938 RepID=A0A1B3SJ95_9MOLU|nr:CatB-related O-acetyltransferase [Spiroplasma helicoides]AOG60004.1 virginiamycin A acetyltransferase [Spiroplasma helicoides]